MRRPVAVISLVLVLTSVVGLWLDNRVESLGLSGLVILFGVLAIYFSIRFALEESRRNRRMRAADQFGALHEQIRTDCCPTCGYSLIGNLSGICPECGARPYELLREHAKTFARVSKDPRAICNVGILCASGPEHTRDYPQALQWLRKAADCGSTTAMRAIGSLYFYGQSVDPDVSQAAAWYRKAAELGDELAKVDLQKCTQGVAAEDA